MVNKDLPLPHILVPQGRGRGPRIQAPAVAAGGHPCLGKPLGWAQAAPLCPHPRPQSPHSLICGMAMTSPVSSPRERVRMKNLPDM